MKVALEMHIAPKEFDLLKSGWINIYAASDPASNPLCSEVYGCKTLADLAASKAVNPPIAQTQIFYIPKEKSEDAQ